MYLESREWKCLRSRGRRPSRPSRISRGLEKWVKRSVRSFGERRRIHVLGTCEEKAGKPIRCSEVTWVFMLAPLFSGRDSISQTGKVCMLEFSPSRSKFQVTLGDFEFAVRVWMKILLQSWKIWFVSERVTFVRYQNQRSTIFPVPRHCPSGNDTGSKCPDFWSNEPYLSKKRK